MKSIALTLYGLCFAVASFAQTPAVPQPLAEGLQAFERRAFAQAAALFQESIEASGTAYDGHAQFWLGRSFVALSQFETAADVFDLFLARYAEHPYREEAAYQRARLFYLQGAYEAAIQRFDLFLNDYPQSEFEANSIYWSAESLLAIGRLDEAEALFREVTTRFPASFRFEAAEYRLDVLELMRRENELLTLLQWSHEEYLQALDLFERREVQYQQAINSYRSQITETATPDAQRVIDDLNAELTELRQTVFALEAEIAALRTEARQQGSSQSTRTETGSGSSAPTPEVGDTEVQDTLEALRQQALELQRILVEQEAEEGQ